MSADIADNAVAILKGNVTEGASNIVQDSLDIAGHTVDKVVEQVKAIASGGDDDA